MMCFCEKGPQRGSFWKLQVVHFWSEPFQICFTMMCFDEIGTAPAMKLAICECSNNLVGNIGTPQALAASRIPIVHIQQLKDIQKPFRSNSSMIKCCFFFLTFGRLKSWISTSFSGTSFLPCHRLVLVLEQLPSLQTAEAWFTSLGSLHLYVVRSHLLGLSAQKSRRFLTVIQVCQYGCHLSTTHTNITNWLASLPNFGLCHSEA